MGLELDSLIVDRDKERVGEKEKMNKVIGINGLRVYMDHRS